MGIKDLNKFMRSECNNSINCISISELSGKKIAVDISIYMYKFATDNSLIENIYLMLSIFKHYNIIPIFIFDGKPPDEKKELLIKRKNNKKEAEKEYKELEKELKNKICDDFQRQEILNNMDLLKKQFIYINKEKIDSVKELIRFYGATYYDAHGEADELCAMLVIKKKVWACLSEDMDLFVYGCPRVLRYFSLLNHTVVFYDMKGILKELGINQKEFREICVISGTDYNVYSNLKESSIPNLERTLKYFKKFYRNKEKNPDIGFYNWLIENTEYIEDIGLLNKIYNMFEINNNNNDLKLFEKIKIVNGPIIFEKIKPILEEEGFVFPPVSDKK